MDIQKFKGQWGGTIKAEDGTTEEMWWSEPNRALGVGSFFSRLRFRMDTRQYFLTRYLEKGIGVAKSNGVLRPKIVDFGCGTGGTTLNFSALIGAPIDGYDLFSTQIEIANTHAKEFNSASRFHLLEKDGKFPLEDESVDVLFSADVLGHVPNIPAALMDWHRVLKKTGTVALFTEATYSSNDKSLMARLAEKGMDMTAGVPEHISLEPKEVLEKEFRAAGFFIEERISANVLHWFFFPKDYLILLRRTNSRGFIYYASLIWNRIIKLMPFYPIPNEAFRLFVTRLFGKRAFGTSYFYLLRKCASISP